MTLHVRTDPGTAKGWRAEAKRRAVRTSDFMRQAIDASMPGALPAEHKEVARGGAESLDTALAAARNATGNTLLVLVSPRQAERLYLALQLAEAYTKGDLTEESTPIAARYAELSNAA